MAKFKGKYRIPSTRLKGWDYGRNAIYFVPICTKDRHHFFGKIVDEKMNLSEIGEMADKYWLEIPEHFPFVILHNHIVMPNHIHGLIEIAKHDKTAPIETQNLTSLPSSSSIPLSSSSLPPPSPSFPSPPISTGSFYKNQLGSPSKINPQLFADSKLG